LSNAVHKSSRKLKNVHPKFLLTYVSPAAEKVNYFRRDFIVREFHCKNAKSHRRDQREDSESHKNTPFLFLRRNP